MRWLNSNMGCMETIMLAMKLGVGLGLNSNMGCMETN